MGKLSRNHANWDHLQILFPNYLQGDVTASRDLFSELMRVIEAYFKARIQSDTEVDDLVQATLLKIHFSRDRFQQNLSLKTWVFTIASRTLIDHWRGLETDLHEPKNDREADDLNAAIEALPSPLLDPSTKVELHHDLNKSLKKLKPMDRSIVYLYGVEGLSMAEIAQVLDITESAAKLRAHRAYKELRSSLGVFVLFLLLYRWLT